MRADLIKLDRALVADVNSDPAKIALIGSLVHFARSTGAWICAEGIETLDELRVLNPEAARLRRDLQGKGGRVVSLGAMRTA